MGVGVSLILIAVGAVLAWAVDVSTTGFNVNTVGYILLIVGIIGLLLSLIFWSSWAGPGYFTGVRGDARSRGRPLVAGHLRVESCGYCTAARPTEKSPASYSGTWHPEIRRFATGAVS